MDITLQQLRMLREVSHRRTIAAAAESLGYTSSAVSQQLAGLERSTGVAVLERIGRNVRFTDAGRELVRHAEGLLSGVEAAQSALERVNSEVRGVLDVAVYESVAATLLAPLLGVVRKAYPDLELRTRQVDPDVSIDEVAAGTIDMAFTVDYPHAPAPHRTDVVRALILEDPFYVVVPDDDPLTGPVPMSELSNRSIISSPATVSCGRSVVLACRRAGFEPNLVHQIDDYPTVLKLAAAAAGIGIVPGLGLVDPPAGVRVLEIEPPVSRFVQLAYRASSADRPAIVAVVDALHDVVRGMNINSVAMSGVTQERFEAHRNRRTLQSEAAAIAKGTIP
jgi:DNA-binding transcriptional LysR family regulator